MSRRRNVAPDFPVVEPLLEFARACSILARACAWQNSEFVIGRAANIGAAQNQPREVPAIRLRAAYAVAERHDGHAGGYVDVGGQGSCDLHQSSRRKSASNSESTMASILSFARFTPKRKNLTFPFARS